MRSPTHSDPIRPAPGYARFVGRVGALALFLGVGSAIAMPAAQADSDATSPARTTASATSNSSSASPAARKSRKSIPAAASAMARPSVRGEKPVAARALRQFRSAAVSAATPAAEAATATQEISNQVSPLGTPAQIARESTAMGAASSLPVSLMKLVLKAGFLAAAQQQFALVGGPDAANLAALDNAVDEYALP